MDMVLCDWTRMGRAYCLAGAVASPAGWKIVRPLLGPKPGVTVRNIGWSAYLLDRHSRWEVFELVGPRDTAREAPHVEDLWVRGLRSRKRLATADERRAILQ